jgi:type I restriction enzyme S subunit
MHKADSCSGTILTTISKKELEQIPLPLIEENVQSEIKSKINESFNLREESEKLLELAKTVVEKAIEENEKTAMHFIKDSIKKHELIVKD